MQTQLTCPNCQTPYAAQIFQIIDVGQQPELKELVLSGQLNMAVCPNCHATGQVATPLVYHDPKHELFMTFVPHEMNMTQVEREQVIGSMVRQVVDATPMEQRKAYMLQPQTVLTYQTFIEEVLATEGITKEMIARQRKQAELLGNLSNADRDVRDHLIQENMDLLDEAFFALLQQVIDMAAQMQDNEQMVKLTNLRASLMVNTPAGREIEKRQIALHAFNREAKSMGGAPAELLLKHILKNVDEDNVIDALVMAGPGALRYEFFRQFSEEIKAKEEAGDVAAAHRLMEVRERLVQIYDKMRAQSNRLLAEANKKLKMVLEAPDMETAVAENIAQFDDAFMYLLVSRIDQAEEMGDEEGMARLRHVQDLIAQQGDSYIPPEILLLNQLLEAEDDAARSQILDENQEMISDEIVQVLDAVQEQVEEHGQDDDVLQRILATKALVRARLTSS